jgi:hypothetical protein
VPARVLATLWHEPLAQRIASLQAWLGPATEGDICNGPYEPGDPD